VTLGGRIRILVHMPCELLPNPTSHCYAQFTHDHFTQLYVANEQALYGFVFSLLHRRSDADDVIQDTMIQLWE
jgi:hypothetical protein